MSAVRGLVGRALGWAAAAFYAIERAGPPVPDGPVLLVANHPNVFLDPLVVFRVAGRTTRPLAKASQFDNPWYRPFLAAVGGIPVWRRQDDPALMHRNEETFAAAVAALKAGDAVQMYPEGRSHDEPSMGEMKTGAARIVLRAEAESGWDLGIRIVPIGLTYQRKALFRGRALAQVGASLAPAAWRAEFERDPVEAVRSLTAAIRTALETVTLNLTEREDRDLIEIAESLWARERGEARWREREGLAERLPRLRAFADGLAWLRAHDPDRHRRLARAVRRHGRVLAILGVAEGEVPPRYGRGAAAAYAARRGIPLLLGAPVALAGIVAWVIPYLVPRAIVAVWPPLPESVATWKLLSGLAAFPVAYAGWIAAAALAGGTGLALAAALVLPPLAVFALAWTRAWTRFREEAGLYLRVARRGRRGARLAAHRARLAAEFDAVEAERRAASAAGGR